MHTCKILNTEVYTVIAPDAYSVIPPFVDI